MASGTDVPAWRAFGRPSWRTDKSFCIPVLFRPQDGRLQSNLSGGFFKARQNGNALTPQKTMNTSPDSPVLEARYQFGGLFFDEVRYAAGIELPVHTHPQAFLDFCLEGTIQEKWNRQTSV